MYSYWGGPEAGRIPQDVWDRLEALEQQIQAPIRIIPHNRCARENSWANDHRGEFSGNVARENGITISLGMRDESRYPYLYCEENGSYYYGVCTPREIRDITLEHDFECNDYGERNGYDVTTVFGDVQLEPRVANSWIELISYAGASWRDYTNVLWNVLVDAVETHFGGPPMSDEEHEAWRNERALAAFNRYVERVYSGQIQSRRVQIDLRTSSITEAQETIARETAALINDQQLLDALLLVQQNDAAQTMRSEFELLASHPRLAERNLVGGSKLVLTTVDDLRLTREDTGESRWLGAFEITFDLQTFGINIRNLNTMRGGRHHPHVPGDGRPCFGSYANSFYELLGQGQLYVCFDLLLQYIETVNLRDEWGRYASYWFEVADERPEGWQPVAGVEEVAPTAEVQPDAEPPENVVEQFEDERNEELVTA